MVLGITLAVAGGHHGFFEVLQGNTPTSSFLIQSIGPEQRFWIHGSDEAVTIVPNFLITGALSILISTVIGIVCLFFINSKNTSGVLLNLFILLTLFGGGIGHIPFFLLVCAFSTNMTGDLSFWKRRLKGDFFRFLGRILPFVLTFSSLCFIIGLEISVFGFVPGLSDLDQILAVCWLFLGISLFFIPVTYVAAIYRDIVIVRSK